MYLIFLSPAWWVMQPFSSESRLYSAVNHGCRVTIETLLLFVVTTQSECRWEMMKRYSEVLTVQKTQPMQIETMKTKKQEAKMNQLIDSLIIKVTRGRRWSIWQTVPLIICYRIKSFLSYCTRLKLYFYSVFHSVRRCWIISALSIRLWPARDE